MIHRQPNTFYGLHILVLIGSFLLIPISIYGAIKPMPCISCDQPAFVSGTISGNASMTNAFSTSMWRSEGQPAWVAYDLSRVPVEQRTTILVAWYSQGGDHDNHIVYGKRYNAPGPYVIEGNSANGGEDSAPTEGWDILYSSPDPDSQSYSCYQHRLDNFSSYNWLRFRTLKDNPDNDLYNHDLTLKMDVYDISGGATDSWLIVGNSITAGAWRANEFGVLVHEEREEFWPAWSGGGIGYMKTSDGAERMLPKWLPEFPGKYVAISLGTNDATLGRKATANDLTTFYNNYESMVEQVTDADKKPVIGTIIWSTDTINQYNIQEFNKKLDELRTAHANIVMGPDLYSAFKDHTEWMNDKLHPNKDGYEKLRAIWAQWALDNIYSSNAISPHRKQNQTRSTVQSAVRYASSGNRLVVATAMTGTIRIFDLSGTKLSEVKKNDSSPFYLPVRTTGVCLIRFNDLPAVRVITR